MTVVTGQPYDRANGRRLSTHYAVGPVLAQFIALTQSAAIFLPLSPGVLARLVVMWLLSGAAAPRGDRGNRYHSAPRLDH